MQAVSSSPLSALSSTFTLLFKPDDVKVALEQLSTVHTAVKVAEARGYSCT